MHGQESKYLIRQDWISRVFSVLYLTILGFILWVVFIKNFSDLLNIGNVMVILFLFTPLAWYIYRLYKKQRKISGQFYKGRKGEEIVFRELSKLPDTYAVFQDIKTRRGNIDFAVVGPTGVFAVEAKSHSGEIAFSEDRITVNKRLFEKNILKQSKDEAIYLHDLILMRTGVNYSVVPVIAFSSYFARLNFGLKPVEGVFVVGKGFLTRVILERPVDLPDENVSKIENAILYQTRNQYN